MLLEFNNRGKLHILLLKIKNKARLCFKKWVRLKKLYLKYVYSRASSSREGENVFLVKSVPKSTPPLLIFGNFNIPLPPIPPTIRHARVSTN